MTTPASKIARMRGSGRAASATFYDGLYKDTARFIAVKLKWRGQHSLLTHLLRRELRGAAVLDVGCGFGRFSLLSARLADRVWGIDMTAAAIHVADAIREASGTRNVEFSVSDVEGFASRRRFDVIYLGGVLEHLTDPLPVLRSIRRLLARDGVLVMNCPREANFRGDVSTTLLTLFDFPMTLSDVRQVTPRYVERVGRTVGLRLERMIGCYYSRAWTDMAEEDLRARIPNVLRDVGDRVRPLRPRTDRFLEWVAERAAENRALIDDLVARRVLRRIPDRADFTLDDRVLAARGLPVAAIREYLKPDFTREPYYCEAPPYNTMGGQVIYVLRRRSA